MELVKEEIIRALECCIGIKGIDACANCPACLGCNDCVDFLREESLALIKELTEERDALEHHNNYLKGLIDIAFVKELQGFDEKSAVKAVAEAEMWRMIALREKRREEEIERLNAKIYEWRNLVEVLNQNNAELEAELAQTYDLLDEAKADTVQKMQERLKEYLDDFYTTDEDALLDVPDLIDQIAKEVLEEKV